MPVFLTNRFFDVHDHESNLPSCASHAERRDGKPVCNKFNDFKGSLVIKNEKRKEMGCFGNGNFSPVRWGFLRGPG